MEIVKTALGKAASLLTVNQVANYLNVSPSFAYKLISSGDIPSLRIGSAIRVLPNDLEVYVKTKRYDFSKGGE